jgi:hypothetical protein
MHVQIRLKQLAKTLRSTCLPEGFGIYLFLTAGLHI